MTYDEVGNVLTRQDSLISKTETFDYDAVNRLESSAVTGQSTVNIYYSAAGRITEKTGCSGGAWGYGSGTAGPFAVTSANSVSYTSDANGRMVTRGSGEIDWTSYDLPSKIDDLSDSSYTEFRYGPGWSRIGQYRSVSGATITYAGRVVECPSGLSIQRVEDSVGKILEIAGRVAGSDRARAEHDRLSDFRLRRQEVPKRSLVDQRHSEQSVTGAGRTMKRRNASHWSVLGPRVPAAMRRNGPRPAYSSARFF